MTNKHSHYFKNVSHLAHIDVYRVLELFGVTDPCMQHAIKKLLVAGGRGSKDVRKDVQEAIDSLTRWLDMREEDGRYVGAAPCAPAFNPKPAEHIKATVVNPCKANGFNETVDVYDGVLPAGYAWHNMSKTQVFVVGVRGTVEDTVPRIHRVSNARPYQPDVILCVPYPAPAPQGFAWNDDHKTLHHLA